MQLQLFSSFLLIIVVVLLPIVIGTIAPGDKRKEKSRKELKLKKGPQDEDVFKRNLVLQEPSSKQILINNAAYFKETNLKRFNGTLLGYVTAWNSHGYDVAKTFAGKFNIISPVWFQIVKNKMDKYELAGSHDIDENWLKEIRANGEKPTGPLRVFPRFVFDKFNERDFSKLLTRSDDVNDVAKIVVNLCESHNFDGIVLELWSQLAGRVNDQYLIKFITTFAQNLDKADLKLILVIPPYRDELPDIFTEKHFNRLYRHVEAFSLITYDFSNLRRPGANSPLYWNKEAIEYLTPHNCVNKIEKRSKILLGLNIYGMEYTPSGGGPIVAGQYLDLLDKYKKPLQFDQRDIENFFDVRTSVGRHYVFYPTLYSINERIKLAEQMGVGLALWELGQGLDYFYDLF